MNRNEELDKIDRSIKDLEIRLSAIRTSAGQVDKEISILSPKKIELEKNLRFQKKEGIVPIAHEYRKVKAELSKTTARLILIMAEQKKIVSASSQIESMIIKLKSDHIKLMNSLDNNVIHVSFGGNRGKN